MDKRLKNVTLGLLGVVGLTSLALAADEKGGPPLEGLYNCATITEATARLDCFDNAVANLQAAQSRGEVLAVTREEIQEVERDAFGFELPSLPRLGRLFGRNSETKTAKAETAIPKRDSLTAPVQRRMTEPDPANEAVTETQIAGISNPDPAPAVTGDPAAQPAAPAATAGSSAQAPAPETLSVDSITERLVRAEKIGVSDRTRFYLANGQVWDQTDKRSVRIPREREGRINEVSIRRAAMGSYLLQVNDRGAAVRVRRRR